MLLGKPVVAADAGGVPELIEHGETGYLVPPGDPDRLAQCLREILARPRGGGHNRRARPRVGTAEVFTARHVAEMSAIYDRVVGRNDA